MSTTDLAAELTDGRADFDFVFGTWTGHHRKLRDVTDPACTEWIEFDSTSRAEPVLGGLSNVDRVFVDAQAPDGPWEGFTLRRFDPSERTWRIWWASSRAPGVLDPPVVGAFVDGVGRFECDDVIAGYAVRVRFEWTAQDADHTRWVQSFSYDAGQTWSVNWTMDFTRAE